MTKVTNYLKRQKENMVGEIDKNKIVRDMLDYAKEIMQSQKMYPWISMVVKNDVIISRGYNTIRETKDPTMFSGVTAVRWAQASLDPGNLEGCSLYGIFQPTLLDFDIALFAGIRDFVWCISQADAPEHYTNVEYTPLDYLKLHPGEIKIDLGRYKNEALELLHEAKLKHYWNDSIYSRD